MPATEAAPPGKLEDDVESLGPPEEEADVLGCVLGGTNSHSSWGGADEARSGGQVVSLRKSRRYVEKDHWLTVQISDRSRLAAKGRRG